MSLRKKAIVCVDDEAIILESLKEQLKRQFGNSYLIEPAENGEDALALVADLSERNVEIPVIISDHILPGMKADELLQSIHRKHPNSIKIFLTGRADADAVGNAVNRAALYRYISKPWDPDDLKITITEALRCYDQEKELHRYRIHLQELVNQRTEGLRKSEEKFRNLVEGIHDEYIIFSLDSNLVFSYISPSVKNVLGFKAKDIIGKPVHEFTTSESHDTRWKGIEEILLQGKVDSPFEIALLNVKGEPRTFHLYSRPTLAAGGKLSGIDGIAKDVTEQKRAEKKLSDAKDKADTANRIKRDFLANMSHELRTPLHGILSFCNFGIKKAEIVDRKKLLDYFLQIRDSGKVLLNLLNNLLDLAKLESGKMVFDFKPSSIRELVDQVVDEFTSLVSERNVQVKCHQSNMDSQVVLDPERIMQIIRNLLSNALKFSPEGGLIEIVVRQDDQAVTLSVSDQGIGVPEDELEGVFDQFVQSTKTKTVTGGTGLGLSICREIITAHKGRIWAINNQPNGATFCFEIPTNLEPTSLSASGVAMG